ncbi:hypothetical protein R3P38DRAFT_3263660 [Favolaschia claudopus]|uniref:Amine oxidase domain-containing protein n=1 Tax=Favolaschia claudopus TaxID=2862362 RepID=A0AAW0CC87_9AGAR
MISDRPRWPMDKELAIRSMHFEALYKMGLRFKTRFWERVSQSEPSEGGQSTTDLPIRWIVFPSNGIGSDGPGVLLVYAWMTDASTWLPLTAIERRNLALSCIDKLYDGEVDPQSREPIKVHDLLIGTADAIWSASTATGDAMFLPGQFESRFEPARRPEGPIYFAGEHLSHHHTWISGALNSALYTVRLLLEDQSLPRLAPNLPGFPRIIGAHDKMGAVPNISFTFSSVFPGRQPTVVRGEQESDKEKYPLDLGMDDKCPLGPQMVSLSGLGSG